MKELLWFLGILALFFVVWVWGGGPERAEREGVSPILNAPIRTEQNTAPANNASSNTKPKSVPNKEEEIRVTPA